MGTELVYQIVGGIIFSTIGIYLLKAAKRRGNFIWMGIGFALIVYCYFVSNAWAVFGIGSGLCALAYLTRYY